MPASRARPRWLPWLLVPARVLLVTFLLMLLCFAVSLLLGIVGVLIRASLRGYHPDMAIAYRQIAFPAAVVAGVTALIAAIIIEVKYRSRNRLRLKL